MNLSYTSIECFMRLAALDICSSEMHSNVAMWLYVQLRRESSHEGLMRCSTEIDIATYKCLTCITITASIYIYDTAVSR